MFELFWHGLQQCLSVSNDNITGSLVNVFFCISIVGGIWRALVPSLVYSFIGFVIDTIFSYNDS